MPTADVPATKVPMNMGAVQKQHAPGSCVIWGKTYAMPYALLTSPDALAVRRNFVEVAIVKLPLHCAPSCGCC